MEGLDGLLSANRSPDRGDARAMEPPVTQKHQSDAKTPSRGRGAQDMEEERVRQESDAKSPSRGRGAQDKTFLDHRRQGARRPSEMDAYDVEATSRRIDVSAEMELTKAPPRMVDEPAHEMDLLALLQGSLRGVDTGRRSPVLAENGENAHNVAAHIRHYFSQDEDVEFVSNQSRLAIFAYTLFQQQTQRAEEQDLEQDFDDFLNGEVRLLPSKKSLLQIYLDNPVPDRHAQERGRAWVQKNADALKKRHARAIKNALRFLTQLLTPKTMTTLVELHHGLLEPKHVYDELQRRINKQGAISAITLKQATEVRLDPTCDVKGLVAKLTHLLTMFREGLKEKCSDAFMKELIFKFLTHAIMQSAPDLPEHLNLIELLPNIENKFACTSDLGEVAAAVEKWIDLRMVENKPPAQQSQQSHLAHSPHESCQYFQKARQTKENPYGGCKKGERCTRTRCSQIANAIKEGKTARTPTTSAKSSRPEGRASGKGAQKGRVSDNTADSNGISRRGGKGRSKGGKGGKGKSFLAETQGSGDEDQGGSDQDEEPDDYFEEDELQYADCKRIRSLHLPDRAWYPC